MAFSLHYYDGDYTPIGGTSITPAMGIDYANTTLNSGVGNELNLFNGNIRFMQTTLTDIPTGDALPMLNAYKYDQLNRMLEARSYETGLSNNEWAPAAYNNEYRNTFSYDANGNILTQNRYLRNGTTQADNLTYHYLEDGPGNLLRNRLYHVNDAIAGSAYTGDLEDQGAFDAVNVETNNNYKYDQEGRLIQDLAEGIQEIVWRVDGKVKAVKFTSASGKNNLEFDYDAFGRRIAKHVLTQGNVLVKSTYYLLDAQGNQLSTYEHTVDNQESNYELAERVMYGSSRLGINVNKVDVLDDNPPILINLSLGNKLYEMSNHLGNILTVINDIKVPQSSNTVAVDSYLATIVSTADYSPFGVQLDGRTVSSESYRWGYQGSEKDDEVKGSGNSYTTEFRMLDPRLGRWLSIDPVVQPWQSPYCSMDNNPVKLNDPLGDKVKYERENGIKLGEHLKMVFQVQVLRIFSSNFRSMYNDLNSSTEIYTFKSVKPKDDADTASEYDRDSNEIRINVQAIKSLDNNTYELRRTLAHETGHAFRVFNGLDLKLIREPLPQKPMNLRVKQLGESDADYQKRLDSYRERMCQYENAVSERAKEGYAKREQAELGALHIENIVMSDLGRSLFFRKSKHAPRMQYTNGVTLVLSRGTCGALFTLEPGGDMYFQNEIISPEYYEKKRRVQDEIQIPNL